VFTTKWSSTKNDDNLIKEEKKLKRDFKRMKKDKFVWKLIVNARLAKEIVFKCFWSNTLLLFSIYILSSFDLILSMPYETKLVFLIGIFDAFKCFTIDGDLLTLSN
jgi:histone deacetylase complex regulatory component SIN3